MKFIFCNYKNNAIFAMNNFVEIVTIKYHKYIRKDFSLLYFN